MANKLFSPLKICSSCAAFASSFQRWKIIAIRFSTIFLKQTTKKRNKIKFESYGDLVDQAFSHSNENSINNQDSHIKIENDETPGATYPTENDLEDAKTNKISAISTFMPQITRWWNCKRHKFSKFKSKRSFQYCSYMSKR